MIILHIEAPFPFQEILSPTQDYHKLQDFLSPLVASGGKCERVACNSSSALQVATTWLSRACQVVVFPSSNPYGNN